ncbi:hypothetical protein SEMRO_1424_G271430.1 [Seminavis robusta]|uniref:Uncharacterized protein n=1 Tax=Seminavis robusta TaxID=568900 RepID=A0A9N8HRP8_9STRA|nr:hypothetical protein SEMRO_1424_G271430.1 [Seminavis robusta]|eukprot:Sro1424_g271430.1 n/a (155) ;mRNA; r:6488-6952
MKVSAAIWTVMDVLVRHSCPDNDYHAGWKCSDQKPQSSVLPPREGLVIEKRDPAVNFVAAEFILMKKVSQQGTNTRRKGSNPAHAELPACRATSLYLYPADLMVGTLLELACAGVLKRLLLSRVDIMQPGCMVSAAEFLQGEHDAWVQQRLEVH